MRRVLAIAAMAMTMLVPGLAAAQGLGSGPSATWRPPRDGASVHAGPLPGRTAWDRRPARNFIRIAVGPVGRPGPCRRPVVSAPSHVGPWPARRRRPVHAIAAIRSTGCTCRRSLIRRATPIGAGRSAACCRPCSWCRPITTPIGRHSACAAAARRAMGALRSGPAAGRCQLRPSPRRGHRRLLRVARRRPPPSSPSPVGGRWDRFGGRGGEVSTEPAFHPPPAALCPASLPCRRAIAFGRA